MNTPRSLAVRFDLYLAACWRGDECEAFGDWLDARWCPEAPPEPAEGPAAVSVLGGAGRGIRWYERGGAIVGYVAGRPRGCYLIAATDEPPPVAIGGFPTAPPGRLTAPS